MKIKLLDGVTATNGVPTAGSATVGFALKSGKDAGGVNRSIPPDGQCAIVVESTAGSGTMTATLKLWVYSDAVGEWVPLGTNATAADKGKLNEGNAIAEFAAVADRLLHTELVNGLAHYERVYLEVVAIGGTGTAIDAWLIGRGARA